MNGRCDKGARVSIRYAGMAESVSSRWRDLATKTPPWNFLRHDLKSNHSLDRGILLGIPLLSRKYDPFVGLTENIMLTSKGLIHSPWIAVKDHNRGIHPTDRIPPAPVPRSGTIHGTLGKPPLLSVKNCPLVGLAENKNVTERGLTPEMTPEMPAFMIGSL